MHTAKEAESSCEQEQIFSTNFRRNFRVHQLFWEHCWSVLDVAYSDISCFTESGSWLALSRYIIQLVHSIALQKKSLLAKPKFLCR